MEKHKKTCLICCNNIDILGIGAQCSHEPLTCWKCAYIVQQYNKEKTCPVCKNSLKVVMYIEDEEYELKGHTNTKFITDEKEEKPMKKGHEEEQDKTEALYHNEDVKNYIYHCTAPFCAECNKEFRLYADYKRHLEVAHGNYICELCLKNRHCVLSDIE